MDAFAWRVGAEGAGIRTILQMVQLTRLDCAVASSGLMRMALAQAVHHCRYRKVFDKRLYDQPLMRAVLADMALEVEGAVAFVMRLSRALDRAGDDAQEAAYARLLTPVAKYRICKLAPGFAFEAMECLGGNGYVEESLLPRLYRESPVNAIWEGSGNVMCLDVLRALKRDDEIAPIAALADDAGIAASNFQAPNESDARSFVERLAILASTSALRSSAPAAIADAFLKTRFANRHGAIYGASNLDESTTELLLQRALPEA
jgi:putative acyl-CoA dehydrogenase